ncbi:MAG: hypothetical protein U1E29_16260 [Coriobacteriia bacterium]|nr:hypothetical protein [Coriobacteriia bacterium]
MRRALRRSGIALLVGLAVVGLVGTLIVARRVDEGALYTIATPFGWLVAGLAAAAILGSGFALLGWTRDRPEEETLTPRASVCNACGRGIIEGWRMCPHCGSLLACDMHLPRQSRASDSAEA